MQLDTAIHIMAMECGTERKQCLLWPFVELLSSEEGND